MKNTLFRVAVTSFAATLGLSSQMVAAQRAETTKRAELVVGNDCRIVPLAATEAEFNALRGVEDREFFGAILASLAGAFVQSGVTALGDALEQASKERGYVAEGAKGLHLLRVSGGELRLGEDSKGIKPAGIERSPKCVMLALPSTSRRLPSDLENSGNITSLNQALKSANLAEANNASLTSSKVLPDQTTIPGLSNASPAVYIEAHVYPIRGGVIVRPVLVWYNQRFDGASKNRSKAELHISFALPSKDNPYAVARIDLPKVIPGQLINWTSLENRTSLIVAARPTAEDVDKELAATNVVLTKLATAFAEETKTNRAMQQAQERRDAAQGDDILSAQQALAAAEWAHADASKALVAAVAAAEAAVKPYNTGATNITARFVVVRDANKFGLAVAKVLKGQSESIGKAVTTELTPTPDWSAADTSYISAMNAVAAKQAELDSAVASENEASKIQALANELVVLKAKANEAAAGVNKPLPYPNLSFLPSM